MHSNESKARVLSSYRDSRPFTYVSCLVVAFFFVKAEQNSCSVALSSLHLVVRGHPGYLAVDPQLPWSFFSEQHIYRTSSCPPPGVALFTVPSFLCLYGFLLTLGHRRSSLCGHISLQPLFLCFQNSSMLNAQAVGQGHLGSMLNGKVGFHPPSETTKPFWTALGCTRGAAAAWCSAGLGLQAEKR